MAGPNKVEAEALEVADGIINIPFPVASFDDDALKALVQRLLEHSDAASYAAFRGETESDVGVILLCGFLERFRTLRLLEHVNVDCLVVQDPVAPWFTGSKTCPGLEHVTQTARSLFPRVRRWLLVGQSSRGYAALRLSRMLDSSLALALAPQTFDDHVVKGNSVFFPPSFQLSRTLNIGSTVEDLRTVFFGTPPNGSIAVIVSAFSEHQNPPTEWLWMDAMHWGRLVDHPDVRVFVTQGTSHPVLVRNIHVYSTLLRKLLDQPSWEVAQVVATVMASVYAQAPTGSGLDA